MHIVDYTSILLTLITFIYSLIKYINCEKNKMSYIYIVIIILNIFIGFYFNKQNQNENSIFAGEFQYTPKEVYIDDIEYATKDFELTLSEIGFYYYSNDNKWMLSEPINLELKNVFLISNNTNKAYHYDSFEKSDFYFEKQKVYKFEDVPAGFYSLIVYYKDETKKYYQNTNMYDFELLLDNQESNWGSFNKWKLNYGIENKSIVNSKKFKIKFSNYNENEIGLSVGSPDDPVFYKVQDIESYEFEQIGKKSLYLMNNDRKVIAIINNISDGEEFVVGYDVY